MPARNRPVAGRVWAPEKVRQRIKTALLVNALTDHVLNGREMTPSQVTAGLGLLRKTLPDQNAVEHSGGVEMTRADELTDSLLAHLATAGSPRASGEALQPSEPEELH